MINCFFQNSLMNRKFSEKPLFNINIELPNNTINSLLSLLINFYAPLLNKSIDLIYFLLNPNF